MASEIRVNKIENRSGLGTVTFADTGVDLAGIVTATTFSGSGASLTSLPAAQLSGTLPAISAANLTNVPAANITGTLPAISAANLTNIPAANVTGTLPAISAANLTNIPAANVTGTLPAITAANLTNIPAANIVGVATAGFSRTGGFGGLLQLVSTTKTDHFSTTSSSLTEVTGLNVTITPSATSSKVYLNIDVSVGGETSYIGFNIKRDSTLIAVTAGVDGNDTRHQGTFATTVSGNSTLRTIGFSFLDTPNTTSAVTYKIQVYSFDSRYFYLNRPHSNDNSAYIHGGSSSITAYEVSV